MSNQKTADIVRALLIVGHCADPKLKAAAKAEVIDEKWSDIGRMVHPRIVGDDFIKAVNRAGLRSKGSVLEMAAMMRVYLLTGTLP